MPTPRPSSPVGDSPTSGASRRSARSATYREEATRIEPFEAIARVVIMRRGELGLSQRELAERMGTSHSAISRIESGQHQTSVETLKRIAEALELRLLIGFERGPLNHPERELVRV
jgi:ribosome-binding protein aMBF1 (putative translation factor)